MPQDRASLRNKKLSASAGDPGLFRHQEDPWRRQWQPTPVFLPGKPHGQRSLAGCTVHRGCKELDTTERLHSNNRHPR